MSDNKRGLALIVTHVDPTSGLGGAERFVRTLMKVYNSCDLLPILVTTSRTTRFHITKTNAGYIIIIPFISFGFVNLLPLSTRAFRLGFYLLKNATMVHLVYPQDVFELLIGSIGKFMGKRIIVSPLGFFFWLFHPSRIVRIITFPLTCIRFILTRMAHVVHVASLHDKYYIMRVNKNVYVIPHGIDIPQELGCIFDTNKDTNIKKKNIYSIVFLGTFTKYKGAYILLDALYILRTKYKLNVELFVIGQKHIALRTIIAYARRFQDKYCEIHRYIRLVKFLDGKPKYIILKSCDLGVIPSLLPESFSYVLSEFNMLGIPVVACGSGAIKTRLFPSAGIIVNKCTPEELSRGLLEAITRFSSESTKRLPDVISISKEVSYWSAIVHKLLSAYIRNTRLKMAISG